MVDMVESEVSCAFRTTHYNLEHGLTLVYLYVEGMVENRVNSTDPVVQAR